MTQPLYYSQLVERFGQALFGIEWRAPIARLAGINERTAQRIGAAAQLGREYPAARGVLAALHEALVPVMRDLKPYAREQGN